LDFSLPRGEAYDLLLLRGTSARGRPVGGGLARVAGSSFRYVAVTSRLACAARTQPDAALPERPARCRPFSVKLPPTQQPWHSSSSARRERSSSRAPCCERGYSIKSIRADSPVAFRRGQGVDTSDMVDTGALCRMAHKSSRRKCRLHPSHTSYDGPFPAVVARPKRGGANERDRD